MLVNLNKPTKTTISLFIPPRCVHTAYLTCCAHLAVKLNSPTFCRPNVEVLLKIKKQSQNNKKYLITLGGNLMAMNRGMGRSWFSTVKKKLFTRTKSPHTKNIIIIHNNTSITGNDEDNRNSCVDAKKDDAVESTPAAAAHTAPNNDYLQKPDEADVDHEAAAPPVDTDEGNGEVEEAEEKDEEVEDSSEEERFNAAIRIQSVFRGHLARRAFSALRSLVKLQAVVRGVGVRKQAWIALRCMHALARLQVRVRARQLLSNESTSQDCGDPVQV